MMRGYGPCLWRAALRAGAVTMLLTCASQAAADPDRVLGLLVTSDDATAEEDRIEGPLSAIGAEILSATAPSNAELRAQMRRFTSRAREAGVALIYLNMPAVRFENRVYVLPRDARLTRATDVFTEGVPLHAFARMAALPERSGAVILLADLPDQPLPEGIAAADTAPTPAPGTSATLIATPDAHDGTKDILDRFVGDPEQADLTNMLRVMDGLDNTFLSALPAGPIRLKAPPDAPVAAPVLPPVIVEAEEEETVEDLAALEKTLAPATKRNLQKALRDLGHYKGLIDGIIGDQTRAAITAFQAGRSDPETGFLSPRQLRELIVQG